MEDTLPGEVEAPLVTDLASENVNGDRSLADQLRERRTEIAETKDVYLPLTGYEEFGVQVRHRLMDRAEVEAIGRRIINETRDRGERNMRILLDVIMNSTMGFYRKDDSRDDPVEIENPRTGHIMTTWGEFATYLGWNPGDDSYARAALYYVFGSNEFAVGQYGILLNRWMGNTGIKVDEEFLGEML